MRNSRLSYLGDGSDSAPVGKGGKTRTSPPRPRPPATPLPADNGVPGPEAPRLDISEVIRTIGMQYRHKFALPPSAFVTGDATDLNAARTVAGEVILTNAGEALLLRGVAAASLWLECSRCLNRFEEPVETELEEEFSLISQFNAFRQEEIKAVDENTTASVIDGMVLDLAELLRQSLLLAAPWQPICREDCPGLGAFAVEEKAPEPETTRPFQALGDLWRAHHPEGEG